MGPAAGRYSASRCAPPDTCALPSGPRGIDLSRMTMCGWIADIATALTPIGDELRRQVTAATYLQTGDTPVTILGPFASGRGWPLLRVGASASLQGLWR
jgi:hypothetical protein